MITGLWNGISGLNAHERALSTQSNNISNVNTVGHKRDTITFEDLMYQSKFGKGAGIQAVEKDFSQGNLKITGNSLDVAISGKGFFMINDPTENERYYSRAGNFKMGTDGTLSTADNKQVLGISSTISNVVSSDDNRVFDKTYTKSLASQTIFHDDFIQSINAKATDFNKTAESGGVHGQGYKTAGAKRADIEALVTDYNNKLSQYGANSSAPSVPSVAQVSQISFTNFLTDLNDAGDFVEVTVDGETFRQYFDTDVQTTMNLFADKISNIKGMQGTADTNGNITITSLIPGQDHKLTNAALNTAAPGIVTVTPPSVGSGIAMVESSRNALKTALENAGAKLLDVTNTISLQNEESLAVNSIQMKLDNIGVSTAGFGELSVDKGVVYSKEGDNKFVIGKIQTAYFTDPQSLSPQGNNLYASNTQSGDPKFAGRINTLEGSTLELSNASLSDGLVDLMVYQRAFQGNASSVTTSDEFLKTAIQLKK